MSSHYRSTAGPMYRVTRETVDVRGHLRVEHVWQGQEWGSTFLFRIVDPGDLLDIAGAGTYPSNYIAPPWTLEKSVDGGNVWITVAERNGNEHRRGTGRDRGRSCGSACSWPGGCAIAGTCFRAGGNPGGGTDSGMTGPHPMQGYGSQVPPDVRHRVNDPNGVWFIAALGTEPPKMESAFGPFTDGWEPRGWRPLGFGPLKVDYARWIEPRRFDVTMFDSPVSMPSPSIDYSEVVSVSGFTENINQQLYYMTKDDSIFYSLGWESHDGTIRFYMPKIRFARTDSAIAEGDLRRCFRISWMDERYATHKGKRTVTGAIRGWRVWKLENDQLQSMVHHTNGAWKFGWNRAPQIPGVKMGAGGFYMNRTLEQTWAHSGDMKKFMDGRVIFGSQLLKGRVIRAREGWRGEFARPEFYIATGRLDTDAALLAMGALYGMEPISLGEAWDLDVGEVAYSEEPAGGDISGDGSPDVDNV